MKSIYKINFFILFFTSFLYSSNIIKLPEKSLSKELSVYNNNLAFVKEKKSLKINKKGILKLVFPNIAQKIITDSVLVDFKKNIKILTEDYEYDLVSLNKLLEIKIGHTINFREKSKKNNMTIFNEKKGILLSIHPLLIKLDNGDIISYVKKEDIILKNMSKNLVLKPSLIWNIENNYLKENFINIKYLTHGLSWSSNYVINYNEELNTIEFNGKIEVKNNSGIEFKDIVLKFIAGDVNIENENFRNKRMYINKGFNNISNINDSISSLETKEKSFADYHLYTIPFKVTLKNNQIKQISMFNKTNIKVKKVYKLENNYMFNNYSDKNFKQFNSYLEIENNKNNNLGIPLPKGKIRIYQTEKKETHFIGEDSINHTPKNEKIKLKLGKAFDLTLKEKTISLLKSKSNNFYYKLTSIKEYFFKNNTNKNKKLNFIINKNITNDFSIESNCNKSNKCIFYEKNNKIYFNISLKKNDEFLLKNIYSVYKNEKR